MTHKIFNVGNILGAVTFLAMIAVPGAVEGEMYMTAVVLVAVLAVCVYLSVKENGQRK